MYSAVVDGKVLDYRFVKNEVGACFYVGNILVGQVFNMRKGHWSAVSSYENPYGPVDGFATRLDAAQYLLKVFHKHKKEKELSF